MSDDLIISGGGSFAVAPEALWSAIDRLEQFRDLAGNLVLRLESAGQRVHCARQFSSDTSSVLAIAQTELEAAVQSLRRLGESCSWLAGLLGQAATNYGMVEELARWHARQAQSWLAAELDPMLPPGLLAQVLANPMLLLHSTHNTSAGLPGLLTDPATVAAVRALVANSDDLALARAGVPAGVAFMLGERGLGLTGVRWSAALAAGLGQSAGAFIETSVVTTVSSRTAISGPPTGFADRVDRLPQDEDQIRIEKYTEPDGTEKFQVYLGGTLDFSPVAGGEPWDLTSNVHGMAQLSPASYRAAEQAMADAGITADSEVVFTGYSQGGLIATMLAASGDYDTKGLFTVGAPAGNLAVPDTFPAVAIEHTDDIIPALAGDRLSHTAVLVERQAFSNGDLPEGVALPAHELHAYRQTAELLDGAQASAVTQAAAALREFGRNAVQVETIEYHAERVQICAAEG